MSVEVTEPTEATTGERAAVGREGRLSFLRDDARLLLLALWNGAALFFSFVVAPSAFSVLRDSTALYANHLAGTIVTRNLEVLNISGFIVGLLLMLAGAVVSGEQRWRAPMLVEMAPLMILTGATALGQWVIAARMLALRRQMGRPIDETTATDPLRSAFNSLHGMSVAALTIAILAALVAFLLIARHRRMRLKERG
jgi:hypothetical protein